MGLVEAAAEFRKHIVRIEPPAPEFFLKRQEDFLREVDESISEVARIEELIRDGQEFDLNQFEEARERRATLKMEKSEPHTLVLFDRYKKTVQRTSSY